MDLQFKSSALMMFGFMLSLLGVVSFVSTKFNRNIIGYHAQTVKPIVEEASDEYSDVIHKNVKNVASAFYEGKEEASKKLQKILGKAQDEFSTKLKAKISKVKVKIEKELSNYSPSNLKIFLQNLTENEKLKDKLIADSEKESEKILQQSYKIQIILIFYY
jgi:vacuolar-type H+-ATPase subunit E/Vma4